MVCMMNVVWKLWSKNRCCVKNVCMWTCVMCKKEGENPGTGGKGLVYMPEDQQQGKKDAWKMSRFEWKMSRLSWIMSGFEWEMSSYEGNGAAEAGDLLEFPVTGWANFRVLCLCIILLSKAINHEINRYKGEFSGEKQSYSSPVLRLAKYPQNNQASTKQASQYMPKRMLQTKFDIPSLIAKA